MKRKLDEMMNESSLDEIKNESSFDEIIIKNFMKELNGDQCPICMEDLQNTNITITKCGHKFCHTCIDAHSYLNNECPLCRSNMGTKTKVKRLCNCDIIQSVNLSITDSNHHRYNLCKRLIKNVFRTINEHKEEIELVINDKSDNNNKNDKNKTELNQKNNENEKHVYATDKILKKLGEKEDFKKNILKSFYQDILHHTVVSSNHACLKLKSMYENQNEIHNHY